MFSQTFLSRRASDFWLVFSLQANFYNSCDRLCDYPYYFGFC
jgi:hypothetical protein